MWPLLLILLILGPSINVAALRNVAVLRPTTATRWHTLHSTKGFGPPPQPPTLEEYLKKEEEKGKRSREKKKYQELKKIATQKSSVHKLVGGEGEGFSRQPEQKKQAW